MNKATQEALEMLGLALVEHSHIWSAPERLAWEKAYREATAPGSEGEAPGSPIISDIDDA